MTSGKFATPNKPLQHGFVPIGCRLLLITDCLKNADGEPTRRAGDKPCHTSCPSGLVRHAWLPDVVMTLCVVDAIDQRRPWRCFGLVLERHIAQRVERWHKLG